MNSLVHFFNHNNTQYCFDTASSSVFEVDELMKKVICGESKEKLMKTWDSSKVEKSILEFDNLKRNGFFKDNHIGEIINDTYDFEKINLLSVSLMVSNSCNMRCVYCFNDGGTIPEDADKVMTFDVAKKAIDYLAANSGKNVGCDFFGGEPLINFELIKQIVNYCKTLDKTWQFSLITNGTILNDEILKMFVDNNFHVVVSYDSILQNIQRPSSTGKDNKSLIRENIKKLVKALPRSEISIRCILTHQMCKHIEEVIEEATELGVRVLFGPVTLNEGHALNLTNEDYELYLKIVKETINKNFNDNKYDLVTGITSLSNIVLQLLTGRKKYYSCGIGTDQIGISSTGFIYPCHRFIGWKGFEIGDIYNGMDKNWYQKFAMRFVDNLEPCKTCWAKYLCGGGCAHEAFTYNGDLFKPYSKRCELTKKEIEIALSLYADALKNNETDKLKSIVNQMISTT